MGGNWAIAIGISQYLNMASLPYCNQDAQAIGTFLEKTAKFKRVYTFADDAPDITLDEGVTISSQPTGTNLKRFLQIRFATPFLQPDDTLWVFFYGHGVRQGDRNYLLPADVDPNSIATSAIPLDILVDQLRRSGTHRIVLALDACHTKQQLFGWSVNCDQAIALLATDVDEVSQVLEPLQQSTFNHALIEGFKVLGGYSNANIEHLHLYLQDTLPKLNLQYGKASQTCRLLAKSPLSARSILMPRIEERKTLAQRLRPQQDPALSKLATTEPLSRSSSPLLRVGLAGFIGLGISAGVVSFVSYHDALRKAESLTTNNATFKQPNPSQKPVSTSAKTPASVVNTSGSPTDNVALKRVPKVGTYYASGAEMSASRREINKMGDRFCIKLVNGTPAVSLGYKPQVLISSLSRQLDSVYVDATGQRLQPDDTFNEFSDGKRIWQWLKDDADRSGAMAECLATQARFARQLPAEN